MLHVKIDTPRGTRLLEAIWKPQSSDRPPSRQRLSRRMPTWAITGCVVMIALNLAVGLWISVSGITVRASRAARADGADAAVVDSTHRIITLEARGSGATRVTRSLRSTVTR